MKRVLTLLLTLLLVLSLAACGGKEEEHPNVGDQDPPAAANADDTQTTPAEPSGDVPAAPTGPAPNPEADSRYVLTFLGCPLPMNADFAPLLAYLGEPANYFEAESCAFEGLDKTYTYEAVEIITYPDEETDRISSVRLLTDAAATPEGITIGSTSEEVIAAYGEDYTTIGQQYTYEDGDCLFSVLFKDGKAISVEYTALTDLLG